jgi:hypothetical protein
MEPRREQVGVRKCPKCGSVWYTALPKCAFCGIEGEELKGPIPPSMLNLGKSGVSATPAPKEAAPAPAGDPPPTPAAPAPAAPAPAASSREPDPPVKETQEPSVPAPPPAPPAEAAAPRPAPIEPPPPEPPPPAEKKDRLPIRSEALLAKRPVPPGPRHEERSVPPGMIAPELPSATVPLVLGILGILACGGPPLLFQVRHDRVLEVLALLGWALLAPLGPSAWLTGQRYAERCRALGFLPSSRAGIGKVLGMVAAFLVTLEFSALAVFTAVHLLSGQGNPLTMK